MLDAPFTVQCTSNLLLIKKIKLNMLILVFVQILSFLLLLYSSLLLLVQSLYNQRHICIFSPFVFTVYYWRHIQSCVQQEGLDYCNDLFKTISTFTKLLILQQKNRSKDITTQSRFFFFFVLPPPSFSTLMLSRGKHCIHVGNE